MISLSKGAPPEWLVRNQSEKTALYKAAPAATKPTPWRAAEIVDALKNESFNKCIYCECLIDDASYSAVEHIRPKSLFEDLVLNWDNLGLVCPRCNTNKGDYWTERPDLQLLNPYADQLDLHLSFRGPLTIAKISSSRGENTVRKLKLISRNDLLISRMRRIEELDARLRIWHTESDPDLKALFAEDVIDAIDISREFSGALRAFAYASGFRSEEQLG